MRFAAGATLGPYEILEPLGAGGMGEVYRARDPRLGRDVAVKVLPAGLAGDPQRAARFEREARSASSLNHPAIVTVHDFSSQGGEAWLVMELVRGESLRDVIGRGPVPLKRTLAIAAAMADGLAAAHGAGLVHRDLKPENVKLTAEGQPKILDFGLVKPAVAADWANSPTSLGVSQDGLVLGTASYMSPEQARGAPVDFRSDQFAFGLILHEMATGAHPFARPQPFETLTAIVNGEPAPIPPSLPAPFAWIVERCLAKEPGDRYGSTADLAADLRRLRDRPVSGAAAPVVAGNGASRRGRHAVAAAALALTALAVIGVVSARPDDPPPAPPLQVAVATPPIAEVALGEVAVPVMISPDGHHLAVQGVGADGRAGIWLHDLRTGATRLLAEGAFGAGWSPDSQSVAYFADGNLKVAAVAGGPPRVVCDARPESTPSWHGDTILFTQYSSAPGIYRVAAGGGTPTLIVPARSAGLGGLPWFPRFLPDGRRFLFIVLVPSQQPGEITHQVFVGSLDGAAPTLVASFSSLAFYADGHLLFVRDGTLLAQPFDEAALRLSGDAKPVLEDLHYFRSTGLAAFSVSGNGLLAWRPAGRPRRLAWFDRAGLETASLGTLSLAIGSGSVNSAGRLSPDGTRYAVGVVDPRLGVSDLWIYDFARESAERATFRLLDEKSPVWAKGGTLYYRSDGGGGPPDIFQWAPGEDGLRIVYRGPGVDEPHDVSPDGASLLFVTYNQTGGADIHLLPLAGAPAPRPFVATPFQELSPRFSHDGRLVAYSSDVSGRAEIYVRPFDGGAAATRVSANGGTLPRWRADGRELYFLAPGGRVMVAAAEKGIGVPRLLFQVADAVDFEAAPDGQRFLVSLDERSRDPQIRLLVNWRARLAGD